MWGEGQRLLKYNRMGTQKTNFEIYNEGERTGGGPVPRGPPVNALVREGKLK